MRKLISFVLITLLVINVLYVFGGILYHPLQSMDAIGIWFLKAKAFYIEHGFPTDFLRTNTYLYSHPRYPVGLPFVIFLIYQCLGTVNEKLILLCYPVTYVFILVLVYKILRIRTTPLTALLFTYIYSMFSPLIAAGGRILAGNADIFLVLIEWIIVFTLYKNKLHLKHYLLITFLIMIASQIKTEGIFLAAIILFLPLTLRTKMILFWIACIPFLVWFFVLTTLHIPSDLYMVIPHVNLLLPKVWAIIQGIFMELLNTNNWYIFWPLLILVLFYKHSLSKQLATILVPSYGIILLLFIGVYFFANIDTYSYVTSSFDRILLQQSAIPFLIFFEKVYAMLKKQKHLSIFYKA